YWHSFLSPEQQSVLTGILRSRRDDKLAKKWKITSDQMAQLKKLEYQAPLMVLTESETDEMCKLMESFIKADDTARPDAKQKVTARLDELAKAKLDVSVSPYTARIDEAKKILTPAQIEQMSKG